MTNAPDHGGMVGLGPDPTPNPITNIIRRDTHTRLFQMDKNIGSNIPEGHAWVELKTSDGAWIPVDPATGLVGDTEEGMATFRDANYRACVGYTLRVSSLPAVVRHVGTRDLEFLPGESEHTGILPINVTPRQADTPGISGSYKGPLTVQCKVWRPGPASMIGVNYSIQSVVPKP